MNGLEKVITQCRESVRNGATRENLVEQLHHQGINIIDSMKVVKEIYGLSLGEAKVLVTAHSVWADAVRNADVLHEELIESLSKERM